MQVSHQHINMFDKTAGVFCSLIKFTASISALGICCCFTSSVTAAQTPTTPATLRQRTLLEADWLFHPGDISSSNEVIAATYDDSHWQRVRLPHDYILGGTFSQTNVRNHGYLPYDVGWYRKHLSIPESTSGKFLRLDFDGVFRDSTVWLNGQCLGRHPSGYTPFSYDITQLARPGADNVIVVRVDPREFEGWWYEGGGIYRSVYLTALAAVHVAQWGTYVRAKVPNGEQGAEAEAELTIQTTIENSGSGQANCDVLSEIVGPDGHSVERFKATASVPAGSQQELQQNSVVARPKLWSLESPQLYQLRTTMLREGKPIDFTTTTFGIRTIQFDANRGFFLNGGHIEIRGTANHQDFAGVGIAVPDSLQSWRVQQLKKLGCNGWRTAHNPPSEAVLDACDRLGMLVMDENRHLGDAYTAKSPRGTTATNLDDLATMIRRDRNHPSIIMWSMCNEERPLQGMKEGADLFSAMTREVHRYDDTRPITSAMHAGWLTNGFADVEDIIGVNYNTPRYDAIHRRHPDKPMYGSECTNQKTTRGEYAEDRTNGMCSCYNLSEEGWLDAVTRPFMAGTYTWTGFDYKGEPNPYGWPDISNNTGLLDACGFPKDKGFYFQSCWSDKPMVHLLPHWTWPGKEGQNIRVLAFSNARKVELFLNGQSLGIKHVPQDSHVEWQVPYQPGRLLAKGYTNGKTVATDLVETTGVPVRIQLSPERTTLQADDADAVVVPIAILDAQGRVVPNAANRVSFQLSGGGRILGVGNGNPADHDPDKAQQRNAFHGHCIVILQAGSEPATLKLTATSPGLASARATFKVR